MHSHSDDAADAALLELLTAPVPPTSKQTKFSRRDAALDPLMIAAAAGPSSSFESHPSSPKHSIRSPCYSQPLPP